MINFKKYVVVSIVVYLISIPLYEFFMDLHNTIWVYARAGYLLDWWLAERVIDVATIIRSGSNALLIVGLVLWFARKKR